MTANVVAVSKTVSFDALSSPSDSSSTAKVISYVVTLPPSSDNSVGSSKLVCYSVVRPTISAKFEMSKLISIQYLQPDADRIVNLRWSDNSGASFGNKIEQSTGLTGEYDTNIQFQRLGYARNRIFEISWSGNFKTAVTGVMVSYIKATS